MIPITDSRIEDYLFKLAARYDEPVIQAMEAYGHKHRFPIIDRLVGTCCHLLALSIGAREIFELGSGFGYSAYWFAKAAGPKGKVTCTDGDVKNQQLAERFLSEAGLGERINFQVGEAIGRLHQARGPFDIIYNDIDKRDYPKAWEVARGKIRSGGLYICDNTLWFGRVAEKKVTDDVAPGWTEAIREHNSRIHADPEFDVSLIPLRDGVLVARRR